MAPSPKTNCKPAPAATNFSFGIYRMKIRPTVDNPDSQFVAMPQTITPAGIELNPTTAPIEEPIKEKEEEKNLI